MYGLHECNSLLIATVDMVAIFPYKGDGNVFHLHVLHFHLIFLLFA